MSKNTGQRKLGQNLSQKLQQILSKNRFKIQNNNPKNGAGALAPAPFVGRRALARRVVVLNFVSVVCRNLLEFLAELLAGHLAKFFLGLVFLTFSFDIFLDIFFGQKIVKTDKNIFGPNRFLDKNTWIKLCFGNLGPENSQSRKNRVPGNFKILKIANFVKMAIYKNRFLTI